MHKPGTTGRHSPCLGSGAPTSCPCEAILPFTLPSPSPSLLQIKSQDLFQSWVAQLRAHRLAQRLDMPRGSLPSTTHRKVREVLGRGGAVTWGLRGGSFRELRDPRRGCCLASLLTHPQAPGAQLPAAGSASALPGVGPREKVSSWLRDSDGLDRCSHGEGPLALCLCEQGGCRWVLEVSAVTRRWNRYLQPCLREPGASKPTGSPRACPGEHQPHREWRGLVSQAHRQDSGPGLTNKKTQKANRGGVPWSSVREGVCSRTHSWSRQLRCWPGRGRGGGATKWGQRVRATPTPHPVWRRQS